MHIGFITHIWHDLASRHGFPSGCPTFMRLAELALLMVSVENECLFSALNFIRDSVRKRQINPHLTVWHCGCSILTSTLCSPIYIRIHNRTLER